MPFIGLEDTCVECSEKSEAKVCVKNQQTILPHVETWSSVWMRFASFLRGGLTMTDCQVRLRLNTTFINKTQWRARYALHLLRNFQFWLGSLCFRFLFCLPQAIFRPNVGKRPRGGRSRKTAATLPITSPLLSSMAHATLRSFRLTLSLCK